MAHRLPVGSVAFVVESETLYVRVRDGFRPATVSQPPTSVYLAALSEQLSAVADEPARRYSAADRRQCEKTNRRPSQVLSTCPVYDAARVHLCG